MCNLDPDAPRQGRHGTMNSMTATPFPGRSTRGGATIGFLLGFVIAALLVTMAWWIFAPGSRAPRIDTSRPAIVSQIQRLQRLETVVFGLDKIVAGERESKYLPKFLAG